MSTIRPKTVRLRLNSASYAKLRRQILQRDSWRCQACGSMSNLEVHHQDFRSQGGHDSELNLITLCTACHAGVHRDWSYPRLSIGHVSLTYRNL